MPLDIAMGIVLSLGVAEFFNVEVTWWFIVLGIVFALVPDIDIVPWFSRTKYDHRSYSHYPIIYVPITALVWVFVGPIYAVLFGLATLAHVIHDTMGIGWGISWAWPFTKRRFLFPEKGRRVRHGFFMTWLPEAEVTMASEHHDPAWVKHYYLRPNPIAYVEYGALLFSLAILFWYVVRS